MDDLTTIPEHYLSVAGQFAKLNQRLDSIESVLDAGLYFEDIKNILMRLENSMADVHTIIEAFRAAVEKEFLDDKAQNDLITLLQSELAGAQLSEQEAQALAQAARDGEAAAKAQVDALLAEIEAATARLGENDLPDVEVPAEPEPVTDPEPVEPEVPVEEPEPVTPEEPVIEPETPVEEPVIEPETPVEEPVIEPETPVEEPVIEPETPVEEPVQPTLPEDEVPADPFEPTPEPEVPTEEPTEPPVGGTEDDAPGNPFAI